jgi:hypothetical protein
MMPLSELLFMGVVFYLLYRFVFNFLVPVFKTTKHVRQQFKNMQDHMQQGNPFQQTGNPFQPNNNQFQQQYARPQEPKSAAGSSSPSKGDYIDFEEIKD